MANDFKAFREAWETDPGLAVFGPGIGQLKPVVMIDPGSLTTGALDYGLIWWCPNGHRNEWRSSWVRTEADPEPPDVDFPEMVCEAPGCGLTRA